MQKPLIRGDLKERRLGTEETEKIMPTCSFIGDGFFNKVDSSLIAIKGVMDGINFTVCKSNSFDIDVPKVTNHMEHQYTINDVSIRAWYYSIRNKIKENNDFVFCVYFKLGDKDVYLEETLDVFTDISEQTKLGELVLKLINIKQFDFSKIKY